MRHLRGLGRRRPALTLMAVVGLVAASFVMLSATSRDIAQASDDWTTGHTTNRYCGLPTARRVDATVWVDPVRSITSAGLTQTWICYTAYKNGYAVDVHGYATDDDGDGYCVRNRIRYKVYVNGAWSDWQYRWPATACGVGTAYSSTWWYSRYPMTQVAAQGCLSDTADSATLGWSCTAWG